jgi:hypothetical protein
VDQEPTRPPAPGKLWRLDRIATRPSTRALGLGTVVVLVVVLVVLMVTPLPYRLAGGRDRAHRTERSVAPSPVAHPPLILPAAWSHRLTFITDSVGLGAVTALRSSEPSWIVRVRGHAALMVHDALSELRAEPIKIERVVVIALGYNSLWEHHRRDYAHWAAYFDRQVIELLRYVRSHGARKIVWVTLRTPRPSSVPASAMWQYRAYAWYFPYVNEQLHALDRRYSDLVLADWAAVSDRRGITYDAIHLDPAGALVYARTVWRAVLGTPFGPGT